MNGFKKEIVNQIDDKIRLPYILYIPENMLNYLTTITKKRFKKNEEIYHSLGINSIHKVYGGHHQSIFKNNREIVVNDIINFIKNKNS